MIKYVNKIKDVLFGIDGNKIVTIVVGCNQQSFDISESGVIGNDPTHVFLFDSWLENGFTSGAGLMVRQFSNIYDEGGIPVKVLYGAYLHPKGWLSFNKEQLAESCEVDAVTGVRKTKESMVCYKVFPNMSESDDQG